MCLYLIKIYMIIHSKQLFFGALQKGKMDQYMLGKWLQQRYNLLLGDRYSSEAVYALSTISDRAVMSGMCLLAGLFPPTGDQIWNSQLLWQPIPVHSYDETAGNVQCFMIQLFLMIFISYFNYYNLFCVQKYC